MAKAESKTVRGVVEATAQNASNRYGIKVDQDWYDGFGKCPVEKGDQVEVAFREDGPYKDLKGLKVLDEEELALRPEGSGKVAGRDAAVCRAVALKCAARLYANGWATVKEITDLAEKLEKWLRAEN